MSKYFLEDGSIDENIRIDDKSIPCMIRFGFLVKNQHPCTMCPWSRCCHEKDIGKIEKEMRKLQEDYPHLFDGTIKTRKDLIDKSWW